ncbi:hypothetical protein OF83DRAFT_24751 [Amylostereum chailletii]|nr:hypothetical protein OF83DRAFT_24751 [Amylostereum chailletii]
MEINDQWILDTIYAVKAGLRVRNKPVITRLLKAANRHGMMGYGDPRSTMSITNGYTRPKEEDLTGYYGPDPYDINFVYPIEEALLETARVKLTPFIPRIHAALYMEQMHTHPHLQAGCPWEHHDLDADFLPFYELRARRNAGAVGFAVIDKSTPDSSHPEWGGSFAGTIGLQQTDPSGLVSEVCWVITFPAFQRTHVTSNAVGILLRYCLNLPSANMPGLGFRRVQWQCWKDNQASLKAAKRMQFKEEGTYRWKWMSMPAGKRGNAPREGDSKPHNSGWDGVVLSVVSDDWENGAREKVQEVIDRKE